MAQSKRSFSQARLERDLDDRIVPKGTYRDALNISIDTSEDANVGVIENLKGNELIANQNITGLSSSSNPNAKVIGSYAHPEGNRIYYFVTGDKSDGIFEHNLKDNTIKTIIIDSSDFVASSPTKVTLPTFTFSDAVVVATVTKDGTIGVSATLGTVFSLTPDFGASVSTNTTRVIQAQVTVPAGYSNTGKFVTGTVTATQAAIAAPVVNILDCTDITANSVTLNGEYTNDSAGVTAIGFYYKANTGGSATVTNFTNEHVIRSLSGRSANLSSGAPLWTDPFDGVAASDLTVKDKDGTTITSSQYDYQNLAGPQPNTIYFKSNLGTVDQVHAKLPITVSQTSTGTTVTNALTAAQVQSSGTNCPVTPITSPFSKALTGLTANTTYAVVAYATNSVGTTLSTIKYFTTSQQTAPPANRPYANRLYIHPVIGPDTGASGTDNDASTPGYGPIIKSDNKIYYTVFGFTQSTGLYSDQAILMDQNSTFCISPPAASGNNQCTPAMCQQLNAPSVSGPAVFNPTAAMSDNSFSAHLGSVRFSSFESGPLATQTAGMYTITMSGRTGGNVENFTDATIQIKVGNPSGVTTFTSIIQPAFASTGTGTTPFLASGGTGATVFSYNQGNNGRPGRTSFSNIEIGPMETGNKGIAIIPFQTVAPAVAGGSGLFGSFSGFDATKVAVSIPGKTAGVDYDFYVFDQAPVIYGTNPGIMIEADPSVLNGSGNFSVTHTVTITYNY